jgi:quinol monooxygenase YgiN
MCDHDPTMTDFSTQDPAATRIVSLIEWPAPNLSIDDARRVAAETGRAFRHVPGLVDFRFFGDFETGRHVYLQVWESRAALDAYMASESMFRIREIAAPFVGGAPTRRVFVDYTDEA